MSQSCLAEMLCPADAWRLSRVSARIKVAWKAVRGGGTHPWWVGAARNADGWTVSRARRLLASCQDTPMRTANGLVKWVLQHVLDPDALWRVGREANNVMAMRLAARRQRRAAQESIHD